MKNSILCCVFISSLLSTFSMAAKGQHITPAQNKQWQSFKKSGVQLRSDELYTLPVVFHIIHQKGPENLSDAAVLGALKILNDGFANRNDFDQGSGVDTRIQFCLAKQDTNGYYTTGINRVYADFSHVSPEIPLLEEHLRRLVMWDTSKYINIWVIDDVDYITEYGRCGLSDIEHSAYATTGGMVIEASALHEVIIHEMGHHLGLLHTWNGWCKNDDCTVDGDMICDTPPEQTHANPCGKNESTCETDVQSGFSTDQPDLETNFMDYGNNSCQHDFTPGQKERMRFWIVNFYQNLLASNVCENNCLTPADAEFDFNTGTEYHIGNSVHFTNTSIGANSFEWFVNDQPVGNVGDLDIIFPGQGWYKITLLAKPDLNDPQCRNVQTSWVRIYCSQKTIVKADKRKTVVFDSIRFSSIIRTVRTLPDPVIYEWYYNDTLFGNAPLFDYAFTTPGKKIYYLVTTQGPCSDTSLPKLIDIKPLPDYTISLDKMICPSESSQKAVKFFVCNEGMLDLPAGLPISFYTTNPTSSAATLVGSVYYTNEPIQPHCCKEFEFLLPPDYEGAFLFAVINDDNSIPTPFDLSTDFPSTGFLETDYVNNLDSMLMEEYMVSIQPGDVSVVIGGTAELTGVANMPSTFSWIADHGNFSCDTCINTIFKPSVYGKVILKGISDGGCEDLDTIIVKVMANQDVQIPTAFTPNGDNLNDYFYVLGGGAVSRITSMQVFNRWGQLVFSRKDFEPNIPSLGWDGRWKGTNHGSAVFVYWIMIEFVNKTTRQFKGTVGLIR